MVGSIDFAPVTVARNLGTSFDSNWNFQEQIHKACKSGFFHFYNIWRIRKYLSQESARTLVQAFVIGHIDCCNSLVSVHLLKLQHLQNAAARLISNVPRYSHIIPVLCQLHWLPVKFRIDFKIFLLTFKAIYGHVPGYLIDLIAIKEWPHYNLCSARASLKLKKTSILRTVLNVLNRIFLDQLLICNVFNLLCNILSFFNLYLICSIVYSQR